MKNKVYILILNWNRWRDTVECIESVLQNSYPNYQVIVIDNGSSDGSEEQIVKWAKGSIASDGQPGVFRDSCPSLPVLHYDKETAERGGIPEVEKALYSPSCPCGHPLVVIQASKNLGYAGGNNVGIRYALRRGDCGYVWLLNNDTVVAPDALTRMVRMAESDDSTGLVGSKILYSHRKAMIQAAGGGKIVPCIGSTSLVGNLTEDRGQWDRPMEIDYVTGASLLMRNKVLMDVGLFDERYFLYWEDTDIALRARRKGYRSVYCPESRVWHKEGGTSGGVNPLTDYYWTRNGLAFMKKFYPIFLPLVPFAYMAKYTIVRVLRGDPPNFNACIKGMRAFLKGKTGEE